jgi:uncharacterized protein (DUF1501 family)
MTSTNKDPILVVVQLTGANDYMNTVIPYSNPLYHDNRPTVGIPAEDVLPIDDDLGFNPAAAPLKELYGRGKLALINGVGYPNPNRSHFRSMDIWHTCEPDRIATEGWLGRAIRDLDPQGENVLTGLNLGRGLPRAMALPGVPVASVGDVDSYGILTGFSDQKKRQTALDVFAGMYAPAIGSGQVMDYLGQTGRDAMLGAELLKNAPANYASTIEYHDSPIGRNLRGIAKVLLAGLGTRIFYTQHAGYDTHANQGPTQPQLLSELSNAVSGFHADLTEHGASDNVLIYVFTEFGRRVKDNGSGTDHGSGGGSFIIGDGVKGGMYGEYPSLKDEDLLEGDLQFNVDFRSVYSTMLEKWLGLDPDPIVGGQFERLAFL